MLAPSATATLVLPSTSSSCTDRGDCVCTVVVVASVLASTVTTVLLLVSVGGFTLRHAPNMMEPAPVWLNELALTSKRVGSALAASVRLSWPAVMSSRPAALSASPFSRMLAETRPPVVADPCWI